MFFPSGKIQLGSNGDGSRRFLDCREELSRFLRDCQISQVANDRVSLANQNLEGISTTKIGKIKTLTNLE